MATEINKCTKENVESFQDEVFKFSILNFKNHGQEIFDALLKDSPRDAANFLKDMMKYLPIADPDKLNEIMPKGKNEKDEALEKITQLSKTFKR